MNRFSTFVIRLCSPKSTLYVFILLACFHWQAAVAQATVAIGPRLGLNLATLAGKDASNASIKPGVNAGVFINSRFSEDLGLAIELNFAQRGAENRINQQRTYKNNFNYLELPVLGKYYFGSGTRTSPFIQTGPNVAYLLTASRKEVTEQSVIKDYKKLDVGWTAGAGIEMRLENIRWTIETRYTAGLLKLTNQANLPAFRNSVFTVGTAIGFVLPGQHR